MQFVVFKP